MATVPRPSSSLVSFWAVAAVGALFLGDSVVRGNWPVFGLAVGPVALVVWAVWMVLYRPRVSFDADHLIVVNPGRVIEVPWQRVSAGRPGWRMPRRRQLSLQRSNVRVSRESQGRSSSPRSRT